MKLKGKAILREVPKRDQIGYCEVHNRFQTSNGRWVDAGFNKAHLNNHIIYTASQDALIVPDVCIECGDPDQLKLAV